MAGRPSGINYVKPSEPSFLTKFKQHAGYKEGPSVETKREIPKFDDDDDERPEADDDKPTVVVLRDGDLTQTEAEEFMKDVDKKDEETQPSDGKILFKKPVKRSSEEGTGSDLNASSSKKKKEHKDKRKGSGDRKDDRKKVKNASLLSFGDDDDEEEEGT
ncbi:uncharacterized protein KIAA1143 homolog [Patiria miniata]|uniref:DUF4604 domain-containing protein n=1 Tax=Patiria miniata TaxID=46514 RepID=A0A914BQF6_PATMI|nr:uncharacterized protein KIAA1143 homolog [Patiria miniata]